jgi:hypothetical protein
LTFITTCYIHNNMSVAQLEKITPITQESRDLWNMAKEVRQGWGEATQQGYLASYGFSYCGAVILVNTDINCSMLMHLDQESRHSVAYNHIGRNVKEGRYNLFLNEPGKKIALPVNGSLSFDRTNIYKQMQADGIHVLDAIGSETGNGAWDILFSANTGDVVIRNFAEKQEEHYTSFLNSAHFSNAETNNSPRSEAVLDSFSKYDRIANANSNINVYLRFALENLDSDSMKSLFSEMGSTYKEPEIQKMIFTDKGILSVCKMLYQEPVTQNTELKVLQMIDLLKEHAIGEESLVPVIFAYRDLAETIEMKKLPIETAFESLDHADLVCQEMRQNSSNLQSCEIMQAKLDQQRTNLMRNQL